jgi:DNA-binding transcriptional MerR regulator
LYTTTEVRQIFSTSRQTVSNWCRDFGAYLSPTATPEEGSHRKFTDTDMTVFALVADMRAQGGTSEMIHAALRMGQRGSVNTDLALVPIAQQSLALQARVRQLEGDVTALRLEAARTEGEVRILRAMLDDKEAIIRALYREIAKLEG